MEEKKVDIISIDLGKNLAIAFWNNNLCYKAVTLEFEDKRLTSENMLSMMKSIEEILRETSPIVVVEIVGRENIGMGIQYIQYMDLRYLASEYECEFFSYSNSTIKKVVAGHGRADKKMILKAVFDSGYFSCELANEHEVDAVACGITYLKSVGEK